MTKMDNQYDALLQFIEDVPEPELTGALHEALSSFSEEGLWVDYVDSVSYKQAMLCWRLIEKLRTSEFPQKLCM
jgi:hypothetical protein